MKSKKIYGVIGLGRFGMPLAQRLALAGEEVIGVDMNEEKVEEFREFSDLAFVTKSLHKEVLREMGIQNCDLVVVCIGSNIEASILATMNIINLGVPTVISKATSEVQGEVLEKLGAKVVYPEYDMAIRTAKKILQKNLRDYISMGKDVEIVEVELTNKMIGKSILDLDLRKRYSLNVIAIHHEKGIELEFLPSYQLKKGDVIGTATLSYANQELTTINLVAAESMEKSQLLQIGSVMKDIFSSLWFIIIASIIGVLLIVYITLTLLYKSKKKKMRKVKKYRKM